MSWMIFNGSPRGKASNSQTIISWFLDGEGTLPVLYLNKIKQHEAAIERAKDYQSLLFVFPLYVDGMPAQVKAFFEEMSQQKELFKGKEVAYMIHSGFSEAIHLKNLEKYLYRFAKMMEMETCGVFLIPGSEGFRLMPPRFTAKKAKDVARIAQACRSKEAIPEEVKVRLEGPLQQGKGRMMRQHIMKRLGLANIYWDQQLKKNQAFEKRFDTPYDKS